MDPYLKLLMVYQFAIDLCEDQIEVLKKEQLGLERYKKVKNANQLQINISQERINQRYDDITNILALMKQIPALVEMCIKKEKKIQEYKIQELENLVTKMGNFEVTLIKQLKPF